MSTQKTIVIVDNNPANLELLGDILSAEEYKVIKTHDGKEGLYAAQQHRPDLILIDKELPKLSSYELAEKIKEDQNIRHIPLLSVIDSTYKFCDMDLYVDCITKPFSVESLLNTISAAIEHAKAVLEDSSNEGEDEALSLGSCT